MKTNNTKVAFLTIIILAIVSVAGLILKNNKDQLATAVSPGYKPTSLCDIGECETEGNYKTAKNKDTKLEERRQKMEAEVAAYLLKKNNK